MYPLYKNKPVLAATTSYLFQDGDMQKVAWRNRIVGYGEEPPEGLVANPKNWRVHPQNQQTVLTAVLEEVGVVQNIIKNRTTGNLIDGHLRVTLAVRKGQASVPITYVELTQEEEDLILASLDPIASLAVADEETLNNLIGGIGSDNSDIRLFLDGLFSEVNQTSLKAAGEEGEGPAAAGEPGAPAPLVVRVLMLVSSVATFELAIARTGAKTRGEALTEICRSYLAFTDPQRQLDQSTQKPVTQ
jgi:hypothetical protein